MKETNVELQKVAVFLPALEACLAFASNDDTRAYLTGVYITWADGKTKCVATDGHKLCIAETERDVSEVLSIPAVEHASVIVQASDAKELTRWATDDADVPPQFINAQMFAIMEIQGDDLTFTSYDGKLTKKCKAIDATYPDYTRVIPSPDKKPTLEGAIGFNAKYLADILKVAKAGFSHPKVASCRATFYGISDPAKFVMNNPDQDKATIVIMPMLVGQ